MEDLRNATSLSTVRLMSAATAKPSVVTRHKMHRILLLCLSFIEWQWLTAFPSAEIRPGRSSQRGAKHFNKSAHAFITDRDCHVASRCMPPKPFKSGKQSRLLPPTAKRHSHFRGKSAHKRTPAHARFLRP